MASITMTFANNIQDSVQVGDTAYYCTISSGIASSPIEIGAITAVTSTTITATIATGTTRPTSNDFIMFSKDNKANLSDLPGYYAEVEMKNDATVAAEMYAVGSEMFASSK
tara:strand:- start:644 stop:976 length:333 start_codon:yes stop_codon:yes gene_type:complete